MQHSFSGSMRSISSSYRLNQNIIPYNRRDNILHNLYVISDITDQMVTHKGERNLRGRRFYILIPQKQITRKELSAIINYLAIITVDDNIAASREFWKAGGLLGRSKTEKVVWDSTHAGGDIWLDLTDPMDLDHRQGIRRDLLCPESGVGWFPDWRESQT